MNDFLSVPTLVILALVAYIAYACGLLIKDTIELHLRDKRRKKAKGSSCG